MSKGRVDPSKWRILGFPMGDGQTWTWEEPKARIESRVNGLALTVDPFTRKHDQVHMFDDPKQLYGSTRTFSVSPDREGPSRSIELFWIVEHVHLVMLASEGVHG